MHRWRDWGVAPQLATLAHNVRKGKGSIETCKKVKWMLEAFIFPALGHETVRRTKQWCGKVFRHAIGLDHLLRDPTDR